MLNINDQIHGTISTLAFGGQGILRHDGVVIFIPYTAPGDEVLIQINEVKKSFATGKLIDIIKPSPERVQPPCPYFGTCGGCQLQHIDYPGQLAYKKQAIQDALKRIGAVDNITVNVVPADPQWGYRKHILLHLRPSNDSQNSFKAGYIANDNTSLIQIEECKIFLEEKTSVFQQIHELLANLENLLGQSGKAWIIKSNPGKYILDLQFDQALPKDVSKKIELWRTKNTSWQGVLCSDPLKQIRSGEINHTILVGDLRILITPRMFIQNHPQQSVNIYHKIRKTIEEHNIQHFLDFYCGMGVTSLMASRSAQKVVGVDSNRQAIETARINAHANNCRNVEFVLANAEQVIRKLVMQVKPDCILVNPPRMGLDDKVVQALLENKSKYIIYVSCMPSTLARDIKKLNVLYDLSECEGYDMFPQTGHVETFVLLKLKS